VRRFTGLGPGMGDGVDWTAKAASTLIVATVLVKLGTLPPGPWFETPESKVCRSPESESPATASRLHVLRLCRETPLARRASGLSFSRVCLSPAVESSRSDGATLMR
jgi:hypothetical protein